MVYALTCSYDVGVTGTGRGASQPGHPGNLVSMYFAQNIKLKVKTKNGPHQTDLPGIKSCSLNAGQPTHATWSTSQRRYSSVCTQVRLVVAFATLAERQSMQPGHLGLLNQKGSPRRSVFWALASHTGQGHRDRGPIGRFSRTLVHAPPPLRGDQSNDTHEKIRRSLMLTRRVYVIGPKPR